MCCGNDRGFIPDSQYRKRHADDVLWRATRRADNRQIKENTNATRARFIHPPENNLHFVRPDNELPYRPLYFDRRDEQRWKRNACPHPRFCQSGSFGSPMKCVDGSIVTPGKQFAADCTFASL